MGASTSTRVGGRRDTVGLVGGWIRWRGVGYMPLLLCFCFSFRGILVFCMYVGVEAGIPRHPPRTYSLTNLLTHQSSTSSRTTTLKHTPNGTVQSQKQLRYQTPTQPEDPYSPNGRSTTFRVPKRGSAQTIHHVTKSHPTGSRPQAPAAQGRKESNISVGRLCATHTTGTIATTEQQLGEVQHN